MNTVTGKDGFNFRIPGAFHAAIQVYNEEWSFGYVPRGTGVFSCKPRCNDMFKFREQMKLGITSRSKREVQDIVAKMALRWQGETYDLVKRNCCSFASELGENLGVGRIPSWIDRAARMGSVVSDKIDASAEAAKKGVRMLHRMKNILVGRDRPDTADKVKSNVYGIFPRRFEASGSWSKSRRGSQE